MAGVNPVVLADLPADAAHALLLFPSKFEDVLALLRFEALVALFRELMKPRLNYDSRPSRLQNHEPRRASSGASRDPSGDTTPRRVFRGRKLPTPT